MTVKNRSELIKVKPVCGKQAQNNNKMNDSLLYRVYDDKLDLLYEARIKGNQKNKDVKLKSLINKSKLFLNIENIHCYRIEPVLK